MDRLSKERKQRVAKQLGLFFAALHRSPHDGIVSECGYFAGRREPRAPTCTPAFMDYLDADDYRNLAGRLEAIENNPANFLPPVIVHGDLYFRNIVWDEARGVITGILDWEGPALGVPALDFTTIADFTTPRNDDFLREILRWYDGDDGLFRQIKENAIIEVMNWFWFFEHTSNPAGMVRSIERLTMALRV